MDYTDEQVERIFELMATVIAHASGEFAEYAKTYAASSIEAYVVYGNEGLEQQIPYVLANLDGWRGDLAKATKAELKTFNRFTN
tara:strand:+ start:119 stop:370 length:252 start_codon:yes stop_codon:yes gene_type:complete